MNVRDRWVLIVLWIFGLYSLFLGVFIAVAPGSFYETLGPFGPRNDHYLGDVATYALANALLLLGAVRWPTWRLPALAVTAFQWLLHSINHLKDITDAQPQWVGVFDFVALTVGLGVLAAALTFVVLSPTGEPDVGRSRSRSVSG